MPVTHQQIIDGIKTRLGTISKAHGYFTDAGTTVDEWHRLPITNLQNTIYHLDISDGNETIDSEGKDGPKSCWNRTLQVDIEHICASDGSDDAIAVAGQMVADSVKAIGTDQTFGGLAILTDFEKGKPEMKQSEFKFAAQKSTLTIKYLTAPGSPDFTPLQYQSAPVITPGADFVDAVIAQFKAQVAAAMAGTSWLWRVLPFLRTELPDIDIKHEDAATKDELVSGSNDLQTRTLPIKSTIIYSGKGNLSTLRTQKEALLSAIEAERTLGGLVCDCLPRSSAWALNHEETAIIGITVSHDVLFEINKWRN